MERLLGHQELPSAVGWPTRQRLGALAADLTDLGVSDAPLPEAAGLPVLFSPSAVWGTLYVAEGATLGGRVLRRNIQARLGPVPLRFLEGHGDRTQPMWRDLGRLADQYVTTKHDRQLAQQTAMQAFAAFSAWCTSSNVATGLTRGSVSRLRGPVVLAAP
jgi:heme oxygenase